MIIVGETELQVGLHVYGEEDNIQKRVVREMIIHEGYDNDLGGATDRIINDIALLRVDDIVFDLETLISPVCVRRNTNSFNGQKCYIAGWGIMEYDDDGTPWKPWVLQSTSMTIDSDNCPAPSHPSQICAGSMEGKVGAAKNMLTRVLQGGCTFARYFFLIALI